ncbi:MAG: phosphotransferase family protein, partial [Aestuariibacter sp.]|nr:phosphotransferase family protein [Aestuariibacter sp.]
MEIELSCYFDQIPALRGCKPEQFSVEKLSGLTNLNYRIRRDAQDWILRIPKPETNVYINREQEKHNYNIAVELGFVPKPYWRNDTGMSLTATLPNSRTSNLHDLRPGKTVNQLLLNLHRLHNCRKPFQGEVNLADTLQRYFTLLSVDSRRQLQSYFERAQSQLSDTSHRADYLVPSHNDLVLGNLLIENQQKLWLIDWEYSAMASPYWDLASL